MLFAIGVAVTTVGLSERDTVVGLLGCVVALIAIVSYLFATRSP